MSSAVRSAANAPKLADLAQAPLQHCTGWQHCRKQELQQEEEAEEQQQQLLRQQEVRQPKQQQEQQLEQQPDCQRVRWLNPQPTTATSHACL